MAQELLSSFFSRQRIIVLIFIVTIFCLPFIAKVACGHVFYFFIPLGWVVLVRNKEFLSLGIIRSNLSSSIIIGVITGIVLGLAAAAIFKISGLKKLSLDSAGIYKLVEPSIGFGTFLSKPASIYFLKQSSTPCGLVFYLLYTVFVVGLSEELFWRSFIQQYVLLGFGRHKAIFLTSAVFTLVHLFLFTFVPVSIGIIFLFMIALAGVIWGYMMYYLRNIWCLALSHGIAVFIIWRFYFFKI